MTQKKTALITGGGTGVGKATALALSKAGYAVILAGRRVEPLENTAEAVRAEGGEALAIGTDIGDPKSVGALFAQVKETYGRLDLLFNNAGANAPGVPLEDITFDQWQTVVSANLTGAFLCTQEAFRIMKDQTPRGGRIINNGSISATSPRPFSAPYTATKHAITGLTKAASLDGRAYDIACGQIDIGNAATDMSEKQAAGIIQANGTMMVEPRMQASQVADAVVHMASLPLETNVLFMTIMATKMPLVGRG